MTRNLERCRQGLDLFRSAFRSFLVSELKKAYGDPGWWEQGVAKHFKAEELDELKRKYEQRGEKITVAAAQASQLHEMLDINHFTNVVQGNWKDVFKQIFKDRKTVVLLQEMTDMRNITAHPPETDLDEADVFRCLDNCSRLLNRFDRDAAKEVRAIRDRREVAAALPPWWQVATPHKDILAGRLDEAVFAAKLDEVVGRRGPADYLDPERFFEKTTHPTKGLKHLVRSVADRLSGDSAGAYIRLQTPFGGGKTHALLVLYHLFEHWDRIRKLDSVRALVEGTAIDKLPRVKVATFVGTQADALKGRTPWGEIAARLDDYDSLREHDEKRTNPGKDELRRFLERHTPVLILIDEFLEYVVKAAAVPVQEATLKGQVVSFLNDLHETVTSLPQSVLVLSLPSSEREVFDETAVKLLRQLGHVSAREETVFKPVEDYEQHEVIRRRLFDDLGDSSEHLRVANAYHELYGSLGENVASAFRQPSYRDRLAMAYPFHPELIDILFERWGTFTGFQRTRGVLRLLGLVINDLYERSHPAPLIQPSDLNLGDSRIQEEFTKHIGSQFESVVASDIARDGAKAERLDGELGDEYRRLHVATSLARSIFFYSFSGEGVPGVGLPRLRVAVLREGLPLAIVGDTVGRLEDELWYLHKEEGRYYFSGEINLNRVLLDKEESVSHADIDEEIRRKTTRLAGTGLTVYPHPQSSRDVRDDKNLKLVVLPIDYPAQEPRTEAVLKDLFETAGEGYRAFRNTVVFALVERETRLVLERAARRLLALEAVQADQGVLKSLSDADRTELQKRFKQADRDLSNQLLGAYRVLAKGTSEGFKFRDMGMATVGERTISERVRSFMAGEDMLLDQITPRYIRERLLGDKEELDFRQAADPFFTSPDHPMVINDEVIRQAIIDGARLKLFGLQIGEHVYYGEGTLPAVLDEDAAVISKQAAERWIAEHKPPPEEIKPPTKPVTEGEGPTPSPPDGGHVVTIIAGVAWDKLSEFVKGVIVPLKDAGAKIALKVELRAESEEPIDQSVIDLKVKETLQQIGAEEEKFEVE